MKEFFVRLTWVDYVTVIVLLRGFYVGYRGGVFPEILRIASYLVTMLAALYFYEELARQITLKSFLNQTTATAVAFASLLVVTFLIMKLLRVVILKLLKVGEGGVLLRLVGLVMGGLRWIVLLSFIFMLIDRSPLTQLKKDIHTRSVAGEEVSRVGPLLFDFMAHLSPQLGLPANQ